MNIMSKQKLLTLCVPTYNRSAHLEEQLKRLSTMPSELWRDISVFVSDNCSTDNTETIARHYSSFPNTDIIYSRNDSNLGMDGNFVKCFTSATSKYVWLLGDDDYIEIDKLPFILKLLKETNCGVCHLGMNRLDKEDYCLYDNVELFIKEIAIWISYISSNIVQTKYVLTIDFEKYYGSYFTLIPLYLTAMIKEPQNVMINIRVFDDAKDYQRNGGYNIAQVFVKNYLSIFEEFVQKGLFSKDILEFEKETAFNFSIPLIIDYVLLRHPSNYMRKNTWPIIFKYYGFSKPIMKCINILSNKAVGRFVRLFKNFN